MDTSLDKSSNSDNTLEDGAWMDSFDKLLEPRPKLRELNILKKKVHASFNRDSSVENSINSKGSDSIYLKPISSDINEDKCRKSSIISTPLIHRGINVDPFKCSLSPIGAWRLMYFGKGKDASKEEMIVGNQNKRHLLGPSMNSGIRTIEFDESARKASFQNLPTIESSSNSSNRCVRPNNSKHVCFESAIDNTAKSSTGRTLINPAYREDDTRTDVIQKRVPSLTLQPGKWRKSICLWRRNQVTKRSSSLARRKSDKRNSSVEFIGFIDYVVGKRKSIYLKPERVSENLPCIPDNEDDWERRVLKRCNQSFPLPFEEQYATDNLMYCVKIGEGAYGEVFLKATNRRKTPDASSTVMKIIPIEGDIEVNGEKQKTFEEILSEVVISIELANLRKEIDSANITSGFVNVKKIACVKGKYPQHLQKLWESFDKEKGSENDHPDIFDETQIYIVLELEFCGKDLESFTFLNAEQAYFALVQVVLTIAVAENAYQFEHRDLHWGNILILNTTAKEVKFTLGNQTYAVPTKGIKTTLIDYTLSRMTFDNCCHYNDISCDEDLFSASGDYQFDIYRMMREALRNNWETFEPRTNIFWISYIISKMIEGVKYKNTRTKIHTTYYSKLKNLFEIILNLKSAIECARYLLDIKP
ncbi:putative serine/threonine-protein kinase haspin homolog isoform X1 [Ceratitis capitata]|uniref:putative serine/threonine-protein kinase haspin homolog isoform X1 n=1 Tax=Ceratitis capitata TaxID=7213 RepID=UPI000329C96B|nr:putative serine/threonine-protein kinase haspin homolog isoform X1 [Ceratitis capitata]